MTANLGLEASDAAVAAAVLQAVEGKAPLEVINIRPHRGLFDLELAAIWRYRELLRVLIARDIMVLYRQAALGVAWAIIQPLFAVMIFTVVFGQFARLPSDGVPYAVFAFAAVLPWTYFAEATRRASTGLVTEAELVRKVYFPRLMIPLAGVAAPLLDFFLASLVYFALLLWYGIELNLRMLAMLPAIGVAALLALAVGLWLGPINVRFRDIKHTLPFIIQVWMYASPVIYSTSLIPEGWRWLYALNPMVGVIEAFRWASFGKGNVDVLGMSISGLVILALLVGGLVFFRRMERSFADVI